MILKFKDLPQEEQNHRIRVMAWSGFIGFMISILLLLLGKSPFLIFAIAIAIGLVIPFFVKSPTPQIETNDHEKLP